MNRDQGTVSTSELDDGRWLVEMVGEFDLSNVSSLTEAIDSLPGDPQLIVDLTATTFIDSSTLATLLRTQRHHQDGSCGIVLVYPPGSFTERLLRFSGLGSAFTSHHTRAQAVTGQADLST